MLWRTAIKNLPAVVHRPLDFDFGTTAPSSVQYVLGMSVPPVMMANLVSEIYRQWQPIFI